MSRRHANVPRPSPSFCSAASPYNFLHLLPLPLLDPLPLPLPRLDPLPLPLRCSPVVINIDRTGGRCGTILRLASWGSDSRTLASLSGATHKSFQPRRCESGAKTFMRGRGRILNDAVQTLSSSPLQVQDLNFSRLPPACSISPSISLQIHSSFCVLDSLTLVSPRCFCWQARDILRCSLRPR